MICHHFVVRCLQLWCVWHSHGFMSLSMCRCLWTGRMHRSTADSVTLISSPSLTRRIMMSCWKLQEWEIFGLDYIELEVMVSLSGQIREAPHLENGNLDNRILSCVLMFMMATGMTATVKTMLLLHVTSVSFYLMYIHTLTFRFIYSDLLVKSYYNVLNKVHFYLVLF